jgi:hypothetical protein
VNVDHRVIAVRAQLSDRRGDRLEVGPAPRLFETSQGSAQYAVHATVPSHDVRERFVCSPVDFRARECALNIGYHGQSLYDVAERGHLDDEDSFHCCVSFYRLPRRF